MALVTKRIWDAHHCLDADYQIIEVDVQMCFVEMVYDDVDLRVRSFRTVCPAVSAFAFSVRLSRPDRTRGITVVRLPGTDVTTTIPTTVNNRLQLSVNAKGAIVGLEGDFAYPAVVFS